MTDKKELQDLKERLEDAVMAIQLLCVSAHVLERSDYLEGLNDALLCLDDYDLLPFEGEPSE